MQPLEVVIAEPFEIFHTDSDLKNSTHISLPGEPKIVMKWTGTYYELVANSLHDAGTFVWAVNSLLIDDYNTNRVRKIKTYMIIASYALDKLSKPREYPPPMFFAKHWLKVINRQYIKFGKMLVMQKNSIISFMASFFWVRTSCFVLLQKNRTFTKNC